MRKNEQRLAAVLLLTLAACSQSPPSGESEGSSTASAVETENLANDRALELVSESRSGRDDSLNRVPIQYRKNPEGIQWLIDQGFAEGNPENWQGANGAIVDPNPYSAFIKVPTHRKTLAIDGVITEGKRATIRWHQDFTPIEPAYTTICVENFDTLMYKDNCSPRANSQTSHALRQDDGQWTLGGSGV